MLAAVRLSCGHDTRIAIPENLDVRPRGDSVQAAGHVALDCPTCGEYCRVVRVTPDPADTGTSMAEVAVYGVRPFVAHPVVAVVAIPDRSGTLSDRLWDDA